MNLNRLFIIIIVASFPFAEKQLEIVPYFIKLRKEDLVESFIMSVFVKGRLNKTFIL